MNGIGVVHTGSIEFDIAAREAEVVGDSQRIAPVAFEEISDEAKQLLLSLGNSFGDGIPAAWEAQEVEESQRTGDLHIPPVIATMLRHPDLYRRQVEFTAALLSGGAISARERELVVLRVAWLCRAPNTWGEHVEMAKLCGVSAKEIERVTLGSSAAGWSDHERALLRAVEELLGDHSIADETWTALASSWSETQLMELPVLIGVYHTFAMQQNSLRVQLPDYNKGLRHR